MTALAEYKRLEALGLWREAEGEQRREVVVSLGEATLVISNTAETALGHWSLPAIERLNPGRRPALFAPGPDSAEELELDDDEMIAAIERIRSAIARARPHPGRLRLILTLGSVAAALVLAVFWLPGALTHQTVSLLPEAKRIEIGQQLLGEITRLAGEPCRASAGRNALTRLAVRTFGPDRAPRVVILPATIPDTIGLPGHVVAASARLVEDYETPEVMAGYLLAEEARMSAIDPVETLLVESGLSVTLRLLTTGEIDADAIHAHAARLLSHDTTQVPDTAMLNGFAEAEISSEPYAYSVDISGESVLGLIEADPMRGQARDRLLSDGEWVSLQEICGA